MRKHESVLWVVHATTSGLRRAGLMSATTMRDFDALCLPHVKDYSAAQIRRIRASNKASQAVFAVYLNTSVSTIQKWESGEKRPNGPSLKLLSLVEAKGLRVLAG
jgi:putative transcriptional regulator